MRPADLGAALGALWRAACQAQAAGTLLQSIQDGIELVTWGLKHPAEVGAMADMAHMARAGVLGGGPDEPDNVLASQQETGPERGGH